MSCLSPAKRAYILALIEKKEAQLVIAYDSFEALLEKTMEAYTFDSGEARQHVKNVKLKDLQEVIDRLEAQIDALYRRLNCKGLSAIRLRRLSYQRSIGLCR